MPMRESMPITSVTASIGTFNCANRTDRQTRPDPGIPGAPTERIIIEISTDNTAAGGMVTPQSRANENANTLKKIQVPSILIVAPRGRDRE